VEHRKALLRSVNAGISVYISPSGEVINQTEVTDSDNDGYTGADGFVADVPMMNPARSTIFSMIGVWGFAGVCVAWILVCLYWARRRPGGDPFAGAATSAPPVAPEVTLEDSLS
jgi:apolipoprotein N-acyltransferase